MKKELEKIGLGPKETAIYLTLLRLGQTNIKRISQKSGIKRTTVYDAIEKLKEKGLVGTTSSGKRILYFAQDPRVLEDFLEQKNFALKKIMPKLLSIINFSDKKPKIQFYEGANSIKEVYLDTLKYKKSGIEIFYPLEINQDVNVSFFNQEYTPQRIKNSI
jgi:sugar-specific transcriptional regulator TrmB